MNYRLVSYCIHRIDGGTVSGLIPYRGTDESPEAISQFVSSFLDFPESSDHDLCIEIVKRYDSEHEWIIDVHQLQAFGTLQREMNLAGDLLAKYELPITSE